MTLRHTDRARLAEAGAVAEAGTMKRDTLYGIAGFFYIEIEQGTFKSTEEASDGQLSFYDIFFLITGDSKTCDSPARAS